MFRDCPMGFVVRIFTVWWWYSVPVRDSTDGRTDGDEASRRRGSVSEWRH